MDEVTKNAQQIQETTVELSDLEQYGRRSMLAETDRRYTPHKGGKHAKDSN